MSENKIKSFVDKIFERSSNPVDEIKKMYGVHPALFTYDSFVKYINEKLSDLGLELNSEEVSSLKDAVFSCSYGSDSSDRGKGTYSPCKSSAPSPHTGGCAFSGGGNSGSACMSSLEKDNASELILSKKNKRVFKNGIAY